MTNTAPVHQLLAEDIRDLGVEAVFGLLSDDTAVFAVTLDSIGVRLHGARHENEAIAMAEGYADASGQLGVALIGRGPAAANSVHAAAYASRTGSPVLIIYGEAPVANSTPSTLGPDYKAFDAVGVLSAAGIRVFVVSNADTARETLAEAVASTLMGTTTALLLPTNIQSEKIPVARLETPLPPVHSAPPPLALLPQEINAAVALLEQSRRPLIIAGVGAHHSGARETLERLAERIGAVLITTARGKDMFDGNPFNLGIIGSFSHSAARRMIDQIDCVLVFGASLNFLTTSFGTFVPSVPVIQFDTVRDNIGRWYKADVAVVGDARLAAEKMLQTLPRRPDNEKPFHSEETRRFLATFDASQDFRSANTTHTVDPRSLGIALDRLLPADRSLVYDSGNFLGVVPYISVPGPDRFKLTSDFSSIGLGFGVALGVAKARPDATTVLVIGDGGFIMTMGELETVIREDLPLIIVVMNDCAYGAELHLLRMHQLPVARSVFPDVDFAPIAEAFGFRAATIRSLSDLEDVAPFLARANEPILLDCKINPAIAAPFMGEFAAFEAQKRNQA